MSFRQIYVAFSLVVVCQVGLQSCKQRPSSGLTGYDQPDDSFEYAQEIIPYNRLPLSALSRDEKLFAERRWPLPDRVQEIQTRDGQRFGLRIIEESELKKYVFPGDVALDYTPIGDPKDVLFNYKLGQKYLKSEGQVTQQEAVGINQMILVGLGEKGMSHAKLVVESGNRLCHVDSPSVMSDCNWEGFLHFFRVDVEDVVKARVGYAAKLMNERPSSYDYDAFLYTDVYVKGVSSVGEKFGGFERGTLASLPPLYCSELPFTLYSIALGKNMFETNFNLIDFAQQIAELKSEPRFSPYVNKENMQQSLSAFVQQASTVPEGMRPMLTTGIKQLLTDGYVGSSMRYMVRKYYPPLVLPQHFMLAAQSPEKVPGVRIVYIGSIEQPGAKRTDGYYSSMLYETGKAAVNNYMQRVKDWWNGSPSGKVPEADSLQLHGGDLNDAPSYLEPRYAK